MNSKPTIIYLVRHGESVNNRDGIISGHVNPSLTDKGHQHAHLAKRSLAHVNFDEVYSSDLQRAAKTAEIVYGQPVPESNKLIGLRERNYGSIEGKPNALLNGFRENQLKMPKSESWHHKHIPDMESDGEMVDRLLTVLTKLAEKHSGQTILIGNHGSSMRAILLKLQNMHPIDMSNKSFKAFDNGGYMKLAYKNNEFVIEEVNGYN